jgi:multidrug transporter EmrE-like cation transporter
MNLMILLLVLISILLSVSAQILLKYGMSDIIIPAAFEVSIFKGLLTTFTHFSVMSGLFAYVASAGVWLYVLSQLEVSKAYPFVGLGFVLTMLFAYLFLNEPITALKLTGTLLIVSGVVLVSLS